MLLVHHLGISQSDRIVWLCEELELDYQLIRYKRDAVTKLAPAEYRALHPAGTAPVVTDGDTVVAETMAIAEYIIARYDGTRLTLPAEDPRFADFLFWYHFSNGSLMPSAMMLSAHGPMAEIMQARLNRYFDMYEAHLASGNIWLAGDRFTVADIMTLFPFKAMQSMLFVDLGPYAALRAYLARLEERPAYQRAMGKAEPRPGGALGAP